MEMRPPESSGKTKISLAVKMGKSAKKVYFRAEEFNLAGL
jgi:hypothetical protein